MASAPISSGGSRSLGDGAIAVIAHKNNDMDDRIRDGAVIGPRARATGIHVDNFIQDAEDWDGVQEDGPKGPHSRDHSPGSSPLMRGAHHSGHRHSVGRAIVRRRSPSELFPVAGPRHRPRQHGLVHV